MSKVLAASVLLPPIPAIPLFHPFLNIVFPAVAEQLWRRAALLTVKLLACRSSDRHPLLIASAMAFVAPLPIAACRIAHASMLERGEDLKDSRGWGRLRGA
eukprot:764748-Hanusia_phi.AAC.1